DHYVRRNTEEQTEVTPVLIAQAEHGNGTRGFRFKFVLKHRTADFARDVDESQTSGDERPVLVRREIDVRVNGNEGHARADIDRREVEVAETGADRGEGSERAVIVHGVKQPAASGLERKRVRARDRGGLPLALDMDGLGIALGHLAALRG